jgi:hypothetical protein
MTKIKKGYIDVHHAVRTNYSGDILEEGSQPLMIGAAPSVNEYFEGSIDEVQIYPKVVN